MGASDLEWPINSDGSTEDDDSHQDTVTSNTTAEYFVYPDDARFNSPDDMPHTLFNLFNNDFSQRDSGIHSEAKGSLNFDCCTSFDSLFVHFIY